MVRHYGRCLRGERLVGSVPHGHWKTLTYVAALRVDGLTANFILDGAMNGTSFLAYVEQVLVATLRKGDIVFVDNLPAHKVAGFRRRSKPPERRCAFCRPTHPISIPLSRRSRS